MGLPDDTTLTVDNGNGTWSRLPAATLAPGIHGGQDRLRMICSTAADILRTEPISPGPSSAEYMWYTKCRVLREAKGGPVCPDPCRCRCSSQITSRSVTMARRSRWPAAAPFTLRPSPPAATSPPCSYRGPAESPRLRSWAIASGSSRPAAQPSYCGTCLRFPASSTGPSSTRPARPMTGHRLRSRSRRMQSGSRQRVNPLILASSCKTSQGHRRPGQQSASLCQRRCLYGAPTAIGCTCWATPVTTTGQCNGPAGASTAPGRSAAPGPAAGKLLPPGCPRTVSASYWSTTTATFRSARPMVSRSAPSPGPGAARCYLPGSE